MSVNEIQTAVALLSLGAVPGSGVERLPLAFHLFPISLVPSPQHT